MLQVQRAGQETQVQRASKVLLDLLDGRVRQGIRVRWAGLVESVLKELKEYKALQVRREYPALLQESELRAYRVRRAWLD